MNYIKQAAVAASLAAATREGRLEWKETSLSNAFQVSFPVYTIRITEREFGDDKATDHLVEVVSDDGATLDAFTAFELDNDRSVQTHRDYGLVVWTLMLKELFNGARRQATGADKALDAVLRELQSRIE